MQGHALYYGRAQLADDYFEMLGYRLPHRVNVADFILDLASGDVSLPDRYVLCLLPSCCRKGVSGLGPSPAQKCCFCIRACKTLSSKGGQKTDLAGPPGPRASSNLQDGVRSHGCGLSQSWRKLLQLDVSHVCSLEHY
jgi:hypothetical protein